MQNDDNGNTVIGKECFNHPFTMIISGSTGSGKTQWLLKFLHNFDELIVNGNKQINSIVYCYGEINENILYLQTIKNLKNAKFSTYSGLPSEEFVQRKASEQENGMLLILDDLMLNAKSGFLDSLFTKGSHNWNVSVMLVTQHLFLKELRTARNNSHYLLLMRNPQGALQIRNLAQQLFPHKTAFFLEAYRDATSQKFSYLLVDMHPNTDENMRLKTNIYKKDLTVVYVQK